MQFMFWKSLPWCIETKYVKHSRGVQINNIKACVHTMHRRIVTEGLKDYSCLYNNLMKIIVYSSFNKTVAMPFLQDF